MPYAKELREQLAPIAVGLQGIIDKIKAEKRGFNADERVQYDKFVADYTQLDTAIRDVENGESIIDKIAGQDGNLTISRAQTEELQDTMRLTPQQKRARARTPEMKAFSKFVRNGARAWDADDIAIMQGRRPTDKDILNAMTTTTGSQGGFLVPQGFVQMLEEAQLWFGGIEGVVEKIQTETGNSLPYPSMNDTEEGEIIGQNVQVSQSDPAFNGITFGAHIGSSRVVLIPLALIRDSYFDLDSLVFRLLGRRIGRLKNRKCTVGTGVNEPGGIVTEAVAAGSIQVFANGNTTDLDYADLVNVQHKVDPAYRHNPATRWMFHDDILKVLKKMVDGANRPLWQPGLTASFREGAIVDLVAAKPTILDQPYIINNHMATPAVSADTVLYGDLAAFKVREVVGEVTMMRLSERYADHLQVGFISYERFDSHLVDAGTHPIAVGRQAAA